MAKTQTRVVTRTKTVFRRAKPSKAGFKKQLLKAGVGIGLGLAVKYGAGYLARNAGPQAQEAVRRAANVAASYGGISGELAYQVADYAINTAIVIPTGGTPMGGSAGEFA